MSQHHQRQTYRGVDIGLPELELFGWITTSSATESQLTRHRHRDAFEICVIARGNVLWWVRDEFHQLRRKSVYVTLPNELHGGVDGVMHPCELYWLILSDKGDDMLPGLDARQTHSLMSALRALGQRTFCASDELLLAFRKLHVECESPDALSPVACRSSLHDLLVQLIRDHDRSADGTLSSSQSRVIAEATQWLSGNLHEDVSIAQLARKSSMSVSHFNDRFLKEVGLTPVEYLTWSRVLRARETLVSTSDSVTRISQDLGFSSSQYFATVFKRLVGMSPAQYRSYRQGEIASRRGQAPN